MYRRTSFSDRIEGTGDPTVKQVLTACPGGWRNRDGWPTCCSWVALGLGILTAAASELVGLVPATGHQLNDPVLMAVAIGSLLRGFTYFNWGALLITVSFPLLMGFLAWGTLRVSAAQAGLRISPGDAVRTARGAALVSMLPVFLQEVDGFQVLLFYGLAAWMSLFLASLAARIPDRL